MTDSFKPDPVDSFVPDPEPAAKPEPAPKAGVKDWAMGAVDTLGLGRKDARTPVDVLSKPQGTLEHVARAAVAAPAIYLGGRALAPMGAAAGLGAGAASAVGNATAAGAVGAGEAALRGDSALYGFLLDAIIAGLTEGAISGVSNLPKIGLKDLGAPARAFQWATEAPGKALDAIASRVGAGKWVRVPSVSKTPLTPKQAVDKLAELEGLPYQQAREEIAQEFSRLDMQRLTGPKPLAGQVFKKGTSKERYQSPNLPRAKAAEAARGVAENPAARAAADAVTTEDPNLTAGAALSLPSFGDVAGKILPHAVMP